MKPMETIAAESECAYTASRWRRLVNWLLPAPNLTPPDWYELHDRVPPDGDMVVTRTAIVLDWRDWLRLRLLGGRIEVETRVLTAAKVAVLESRGRTLI